MSFDTPNQRFAFGGKVAGVGFVTMGLSAIPICLVNRPIDLYVPWLIGAVITYGITCLFIPWQRVNIRLPYALPALATAVVALSTVIVTPVYAFSYVFIGLIVALTGTRTTLLAHLALITAALGLTAILDPGTDNLMVTIALLEIPLVWLMSLVAFSLVRAMDQRRFTLENLSREDGLTGVGNYRALQECLSDRIGKGLPRGSPFALILLDLDDFKKVNEELGHLGGDRVLADVGETLRSSVRSVDLVFRQGGDEFAVVVPGMDAEDADQIATRLTERLLHGTVEHTAACHGVAVYPEDGGTSDQLLNQADLALMTQKRMKRVAPPSSRPAAPQA